MMIYRGGKLSPPVRLCAPLLVTKPYTLNPTECETERAELLLYVIRVYVLLYVS